MREEDGGGVEVKETLEMVLQLIVAIILSPFVLLGEWAKRVLGIK